MSLIEGSAFHCFKDGYETTNLDEWNAHCSKEENGSTHITEEGGTACIICGVKIEFKDLPFHPLKADGSKGIQLKCEPCEAKTLGKVKRSSPV